jgi:dihydrofolate reductase
LESALSVSDSAVRRIDRSNNRGQTSVFGSLEMALNLASTAATVFIIGGEQIYAQAMAVADRLEITKVDRESEGDAWFPEIAAVD